MCENILYGLVFVPFSEINAKWGKALRDLGEEDQTMNHIIQRSALDANPRLPAHVIGLTPFLNGSSKLLIRCIGIRQEKQRIHLPN